MFSLVTWTEAVSVPKYAAVKDVFDFVTDGGFESGLMWWSFDKAETVRDPYKGVWCLELTAEYGTPHWVSQTLGQLPPWGGSPCPAQPPFNFSFMAKTSDGYTSLEVWLGDEKVGFDFWYRGYITPPRFWILVRRWNAGLNVWENVGEAVWKVGEWQKLELNFKDSSYDVLIDGYKVGTVNRLQPLVADKVSLVYYYNLAGGKIHIDEVHLYGFRNLVVNGDFESATLSPWQPFHYVSAELTKDAYNNLQALRLRTLPPPTGTAGGCGGYVQQNFSEHSWVSTHGIYAFKVEKIPEGVEHFDFGGFILADDVNEMNMHLTTNGRTVTLISGMLGQYWQAPVPSEILKGWHIGELILQPYTDEYGRKWYRVTAKIDGVSYLTWDTPHISFDRVKLFAYSDRLHPDASCLFDSVKVFAP